MLLKVFPNECPIFCLGDLVTFRHIETCSSGLIVSCVNDVYDVIFSFGKRQEVGERLKLVDEKLAAYRSTVFRSAMLVHDGVLKMKPSFILTRAMRISDDEKETSMTNPSTPEDPELDALIGLIVDHTGLPRDHRPVNQLSDYQQTRKMLETPPAVLKPKYS